MAQITLNIPDAVLPRVIDAFATVFDFANTKLEDETQAQFAKRQLAKFARDVVENAESKSSVENFRVASEAARQASITQTRNDVVIT